jgi:hypothetical protein
MLRGLRFGKRMGTLEVPHATSGTKSARRVTAVWAGDLDGFGSDIREPPTDDRREGAGMVEWRHGLSVGNAGFESAAKASLSNFDQGIGTTGRFLNRKRHGQLRAQSTLLRMSEQSP